jgi:hypothetical protein
MPPSSQQVVYEEQALAEVRGPSRGEQHPGEIGRAEGREPCQQEQRRPGRDGGNAEKRNHAGRGPEECRRT